MNVYEQTSDVRRNLRIFFAIVLTALIAGQAWFAIDPRPEQLTRAVRNADDPFMSAWALLLGAAVAGTFFLARFIMAAAMPQKNRGKLPAVLGVLAAIVLLGGVITGMLAESAAIAVTLSVVSSWLAPKPEVAG